MAIDTMVNGGTEDFFNFDTGLVVESGGTAIGTTVSGGIEVVLDGGTDYGAQIIGAPITSFFFGFQEVFGRASGASVFSGSQVVESGGTATGITVNGGALLLVDSGGAASKAVVNSGGRLLIAAKPC